MKEYVIKYLCLSSSHGLYISCLECMVSLVWWWFQKLYNFTKMLSNGIPTKTANNWHLAGYVTHMNVQCVLRYNINGLVNPYNFHVREGKFLKICRLQSPLSNEQKPDQNIVGVWTLYHITNVMISYPDSTLLYLPHFSQKYLL